MENPSFEGSSSAFKLPDLGTTKKGSVKYVKSVDEIVAKPAVVNFENAERGQVYDKKMKPVLKKHIMSKKWTKLEIGMTLVNFFILLTFFIASMVAIYKILNDSNFEKLTTKLPQILKDIEKMQKKLKAFQNA